MVALTYVCYAHEREVFWAVSTSRSDLYIFAISILYDFSKNSLVLHFVTYVIMKYKIQILGLNRMHALVSE